MNEREIYLLEKALDDLLSGDEKNEFELLLNNSKKFYNEFYEQKEIKEALNKMRMKNPSNEVWDSYWQNIYNRLERGFGWILISIGAIIIFSFAAVAAVESFLYDTQTPFLLKVGISVLIIGGIILLISVVREKLFTNKNDKYKEIQR